MSDAFESAYSDPVRLFFSAAGLLRCTMGRRYIAVPVASTEKCQDFSMRKVRQRLPATGKQISADILFIPGREEEITPMRYLLKAGSGIGKTDAQEQAAETPLKNSDEEYYLNEKEGFRLNVVDAALGRCGRNCIYQSESWIYGTVPQWRR